MKDIYILIVAEGFDKTYWDNLHYINSFMFARFFICFQCIIIGLMHNHEYNYSKQNLALLSITLKRKQSRDVGKMAKYFDTFGIINVVLIKIIWNIFVPKMDAKPLL